MRALVADKAHRNRVVQKGLPEARRAPPCCPLRGCPA